MTTEQKARAYDEALKQAKKELDTCGSLDCDAARQIFRLFPQLREIEDERIKNLIYCIVRDRSDVGKLLEANGCPVEKALSWIEEQKEPKPESCDCSRDEESYTNGIHHVLMNPEAYGLIKQKPAEWSEEDEGMLNCIIATLCEESHGGRETNNKMVTWLENRLKSLRPVGKEFLQPH